MKKTKKTPSKSKEKKSYTETNAFEESQKSTFVAPVTNERDIFPKPQTRFPSLSVVAVLLLVGAIGGMLFAYQGMPLAAIVNGTPIFRWDIANVLFKRYGAQTLEGMVTEQLIVGEAQKSQINVTQSDIDQKAQDILKNFGSDLTVEDFLKFQGLEKADFDNQIKLQLTVQKILSKDLTITDSDADNYIATNRATLVATDPAELRAEAKNAILDEKVSEKIQTWLSEIKAKASVKKFL